jgi:glycosyltransferase involved in cell wall biosynthesis
LRILVVSRHMPPAVVAPVDKGGGTDTFMRALLDFPRRRAGVELDIVTLAPEGREIAVPSGVRVHYVRSRMLRNLLYAFRYATNPLANVVLLGTTIAALCVRSIGPSLRRRYDVVYAVGGPIAGGAAWIVARCSGLPVAMHFHWAYRFSAARPLVRALARFFYERFDVVIGNSRLLVDDAAKLGVRRTTVTYVHNWVDARQFRPLPDRADLRARWGIAPDRLVFLYVGRFDYVKGTDNVLAALRAERYDATFLFAGDGPLAADLAAVAPFNDVRMLGTREANELVELHAVADVLLWGSTDVDYPSLVVMEAMTSGLPVTIADASTNPLYWHEPVEPELLGGPDLTPRYSSSPAGVAAAIRESIARRIELASRRDAARAYALRHFGSANAERLLDVLTSLRRR